MDLRDARIGVVGLGYVGLPLAVEFGKLRPVVGFDAKANRIENLRRGHDATGEIEPAELVEAVHLSFSGDPADLEACQVFIVAVPTPVDDAKRPDLSLLEHASETVGRAMRRGAVVIYESTVFPGCTRQICVPLLERFSGLELDRDFWVGYSPERINPGDRNHRLVNITKVTSGSTPDAAAAIDELYGQIVTAGTYRAASIEVAEAAKVIENTQRDLNIALMNELAILFHKLGLDSTQILEAAETKWNFLPFRPGLVGGHCIGVDPYYLTHRAQQIGYHPEIILAGRRINDGMGAHVVDRLMRQMMQRGFPVVGSHVLVMGLAFKENCRDLRNTRVIDVIEELRSLHAHVDVWDPWVDPEQARDEYGLEVTGAPGPSQYEAVVLAVAHREFVELGAERIRSYGKPSAVFFDVKSAFDKHESDVRL